MTYHQKKTESKQTEKFQIKKVSSDLTYFRSEHSKKNENILR
jgi:hypothetical protein